MNSDAIFSGLQTLATLNTGKKGKAHFTGNPSVQNRGKRLGIPPTLKQLIILSTRKKTMTSFHP